MSKIKLTYTSVASTREAAAESVTAANQHLEAFKARLVDDHRLAATLTLLMDGILDHVNNRRNVEMSDEFAERLEPTANSYGFTFVPHPTLRGMVTLEPIKETA